MLLKQFFTYRPLQRSQNKCFIRGLGISSLIRVWLKKMLVKFKTCPAGNTHTHKHSINMCPIRPSWYYSHFRFRQTVRGFWPAFLYPRAHVLFTFYFSHPHTDSVVTFSLSRRGFNQQQPLPIQTQTKASTLFCMHTYTLILYLHPN